MQCAAGVWKPALWAAAVMGRCFWIVVFLSVHVYLQRRRQHSATILHRALPVYEWLALGMP